MIKKLMWVVILAGAGYAGYRGYKYWKVRKSVKEAL